MVFSVVWCLVFITALILGIFAAINNVDTFKKFDTFLFFDLLFVKIANLIAIIGTHGLLLAQVLMDDVSQREYTYTKTRIESDFDTTDEDRNDNVVV